MLTWAKRIRSIEYKGGKCMRCGFNNIFCMEFHHISRSTKEFDIRKGCGTLSWSKIKKELDKCDMYCANCHSEVEEEVALVLEYNCGYPQYAGKQRTNKIYFLEYKFNYYGDLGKPRCMECGYVGSNNRSLEFHHRSGTKKLFNISDVSKRFHSVYDVDIYTRNELDKCDVICRNCHTVDRINMKRFNRLRDVIYGRKDNLPKKKELIKVNRPLIYKLKDIGWTNTAIAKEVGCVRSSVTYALQLRDKKEKKSVQLSLFDEWCLTN